MRWSDDGPQAAGAPSRPAPGWRRLRDREPPAEVRRRVWGAKFSFLRTSVSVGVLPTKKQRPLASGHGTLATPPEENCRWSLSTGSLSLGMLALRFSQAIRVARLAFYIETTGRDLPSSQRARTQGRLGFHGSVCSLTQPGLGSDFWGLNPSLTASPEGSGLSGFGDTGQRTCPARDPSRAAQSWPGRFGPDYAE
ncbi:unnamed protein product [Rangifer tarandus platyrhynchus]|uniref:Uncharacterized protein n=1 Tax=Rangifer tarandus platyrhynchus TaxID=3082113 RepID=A0AC59Z6E8_RANTA